MFDRLLETATIVHRVNETGGDVMLPDHAKTEASSEGSDFPGSRDWYSSTYMLHLALTQEDVDSVPKHGPADRAVELLFREPRISEQLNALDKEKLKKELSGCGAWDDEDLADEEMNMKRILWLAIGDLQEEDRTRGEEDDSQEGDESDKEETKCSM